MSCNVLMNVLSIPLELPTGGMVGVVEEERDVPFGVFIKLSSTALDLSAGGMTGVVEEERDISCDFLAEL